MTTDVGTKPAEAAVQRQHAHYPAIDGLRAVAVLLVVLNHASVGGFERGFLGVDMFFALSGFLITDRIVASWGGDHSSSLVAFWAGRARRLLPVMSVVIAVTCVGSALVLSPQELSRTAGYGLAANFFTVNNLIAARGGNYFEGPLRELPFLHLWSLGVEEQFYLVWPVLLGPFAVLAARRTGASYRRAIAVGLALVIVASFAAAIVLTRTNDLWAFYSLPARAYEFALGGAAVLFWHERSSVATKRLWLGLVGIAAIGIAMVATPVGRGFPSAWPLLVAGGTILVILGTEPAGAAPSRLTQVLGSGPLRFIGRYSYGWYLWHWPALLLVGAEWGTGWGRVASAVSLVPAMATFHLVEQPIRYHPGLMRSNLRSLIIGGLALAVSAGACVSLIGYARVRMRDPFIKDLHTAEESYAIAGCTVDTDALGEPVCLGGSPDTSSPLVLLIGDSHAAQWTAAFSEAGRTAGFRVATRTYGNCSSFLPVKPSPLVDEGCSDYERTTLRLAQDPRVGAVVFAEALSSRHVHGTPAGWFDAAKAQIERIDHPTGLVIDSPSLRDPLRCLARGNPAEDCQVSRALAYEQLNRYAPFEHRLAADESTSLFDIGSIVCADDPCPLQSNGTWIAARAEHLNRDFTLQQTGQIITFVDQLIARR